MDATERGDWPIVFVSPCGCCPAEGEGPAVDAKE